MLTQCPKCETVYQIESSQLEARDGLVRCGRCRNVFNAAWNLLDSPSGNPLPEPEAEPQTPVDDEQADWIKRLHAELAEEFRPTVTEGERTTPALPAEGFGQPQAQPELRTPPADEPAPVPLDAADTSLEEAEGEEPPAAQERWGWGMGSARGGARGAPDATERVEPDLAPAPPRERHRFAHHAPDEEIVLETPVDSGEWPAALNADGPEVPVNGAPAAGRRRAATVRQVSIPIAAPARRRNLRKWWITGSIVLTLLVILQLFYFFFDSLANVNMLRPALERMCEVLGCELPARRAQSMVELIESHIAASPQRDDALRVSATLVNRAGFEQEFPELEVALTNNQGQLIARTTFEPQQYLGAGARTLPVMPADQPIAVRIDLSRPLDDAVGYEVVLVSRAGGGTRPDLAAMGRHVFTSTGTALQGAASRVRDFLRDLAA